MSVGRVIVVTGTNTEIGKTIATAALAVVAAAEGSVVVVKPVQTGVGPDDLGDAGEVHRLTGAQAQEFTALRDPLAPDTAAMLRRERIPPIKEYADRVRVLTEFHDLVIVEGAGGLLVRLDSDGGTILDFAAQLEADVVIVTSAELGTLNHTELTVLALRARGIEPAGLIIGSWPHEPNLAEECNADDLPRITGVPVIATIPAGAGALSPNEFRGKALSWFN
jgi:dethiobiotin synthetase